MDVFLRWYPQSLFRTRMAQTILERMVYFRGIRLYVLYPKHLGATVCTSDPWFKAAEIPWEADFHVESKSNAELRASDIYCVIDDDQLPIYPDFFDRGREALANHPEYGMVAGYSLIEHAQVPRSADVVEMHAIGCPYFVRKGTLTFPEGPKEQYDGILSKVVTDQGLKTGIATKCLYNHLGHGFSQVIPGHNALDGD